MNKCVEAIYVIKISGRLPRYFYYWTDLLEDFGKWRENNQEHDVIVSLEWITDWLLERLEEERRNE